MIPEIMFSTLNGSTRNDIGEQLENIKILMRITNPISISFEGNCIP